MDGSAADSRCRRSPHGLTLFTEANTMATRITVVSTGYVGLIQAVGADMSLLKAETDDIRESPAVAIVHRLLDGGATVRVHNPKAFDHFRSIFSDQIAYFHNEFECLTGADRAVTTSRRNRMDSTFV